MSPLLQRTASRPYAVNWYPRCIITGLLALAGFLVYKTAPEGTANTPPAALALPQAAQPITQPIEQVQVGQRVVTNRPTSAGAAVVEPEPDPATWRKLRLRMQKPDGGQVDIVLLRPVAWIARVNAKAGATIDLDLPEMGAFGQAEVLAVEPCPTIQGGNGRVVTATFRHTANEVLDLRVTGLDEPIGVTPTHPFWSVDRDDFVPVSQLRIGERVLRADGQSSEVVALLPRPGPETVYNLEVNGEHVYRVSPLGLLVHNFCPNQIVTVEELLATSKTLRRNYLNQKFGRSGNLHADINARGVPDAIRANARLATDYARMDAIAGSITNSPQEIGIRAHQYFARLNNRLSNRVAGNYRVATEQFRNTRGRIVAPRSAGSIGADVLYTPWQGGVSPIIYDLKTYSTFPRAIGRGRQWEFQRRFGAPAQEIYVPQ